MGSEDVDAGSHAVPGAVLGSRAGFRLFWGRGSAGQHLSLDALLTAAQLDTCRARAAVSEAALRAVLPGPWGPWFDALAPRQRRDVQWGLAAE